MMTTIMMVMVTRMMLFKKMKIISTLFLRVNMKKHEYVIILHFGYKYKEEHWDVITIKYEQDMFPPSSSRQTMKRKMKMLSSSSISILSQLTVDKCQLWCSACLSTTLLPASKYETRYLPLFPQECFAGMQFPSRIYELPAFPMETWLTGKAKSALPEFKLNPILAEPHCLFERWMVFRE